MTTQQLEFPQPLLVATPQANPERPLLARQQTPSRDPAVRRQANVLRNTDYCCHGCWQDLRLLPQTRWRVVAVPAKVRGSLRGAAHVGACTPRDAATLRDTLPRDAGGVHWLAMCEACATAESLRRQAPAPVQPQELVQLQDAARPEEIAALTVGQVVLDREEISLVASAVGLLSGWLVAGPALAAVGLVAGAAAGVMAARELRAA